MGLCQTQKLLCIKGHTQESEKTTYRMGENIHRPDIQQGAIIQNM